jgi:hypothetical protein
MSEKARFNPAFFYTGMIVIVAIAIEALAFAFYGMARNVGYFAPQPSYDEFVKTLAHQYGAHNFDPNLGWVTPRHEVEANGARHSPDNPASGRPCLSLYGDSFVFGTEVDDRAAWGNQLAKKMGCKVSNFGVSGYGTDQAFLRFESHSSEKSDAVILGILSENIIRNVNQNRSYLYGGTVGPLKPVFRVDGSGGLRLIPPPKLDATSYDDYVNHPERLFPADFFIPDSSAYAQQHAGFPYSISAFRVFRYKRVSDGLLYFVLRNPPWFAELYDPAHPSNALQVSQGIVRRFSELAKQRRKIGIVMFIPTSRDIGHFLKSGHWTYQTLYDRCVESGGRCFDAGAAMVELIGARQLADVGVCEYFCTAHWTQSAHYNEKGHAILADAVHSYLKASLPGDRGS